MVTTNQVLNRIGGDHVPAIGGSSFERRNPADRRDVVTVAPDSDERDVRLAVDAATEASGVWKCTTPTLRAEVLTKAARVLQGKNEILVNDMVREQGKLLVDARNECSRTPRNLELYAGEAYRLTGTTFPSDDTPLVYSVLDPVGVVGVITPWNFPLNLASRKIGPALAAGNTVVFKPSPMAPLLGDHLAAAFEEAGLPPGVLNVVHGASAGAPLVADERVGAITFTGSNATGRKIHQVMGIGRRVQLELGGKNPVVVLADADPAAAATVINRSCFALAGQACTGAGRILVDRRIFDDVLQRVIDLARAYVLGVGANASATMGPLVDEVAIESMEAAISRATIDGAKIVVGGARDVKDELVHGNFFLPTIITNVNRSAWISCNEVFGPVVTFEVVDGIADAIESANSVPFGLSAAVCTRDLASAQKCAEEIQAGMVRINRPTVGAAFNAPFGGIKQSGTGTHKEQLGPTVMDFYTVMRTVWFGN